MTAPTACDPCGCISANIGKDYAKQAILTVACSILSAIEGGGGDIPITDCTLSLGDITHRFVDLYLCGHVREANDQSIQWRNALNSGWLDVIKADSNNDTVINTPTAGNIYLEVNGVKTGRFTASGFYNYRGTTSNKFLVYADSTDGADNLFVQLAGGGDAAASRGGYIDIRGNEAATIGGSVNIQGGAVSTGSIDFALGHASANVRILNTSSSTLWQFQNDGSFAQGSAANGNIIFNSSSAQALIIKGTADATDNASILIGGGGGAASSRGGSIAAYGNEAASTGGAVITQGGAVSTGHIDHVLGNSSAAFRFINASAATVINMSNAGSINISAIGVSNEVAVSDATITGKIRIVTGDRFYVGTSSAHNLALMTSGSLRWGINTSGQLVQDGTNGGDIIFTTNNFQIVTNTADASDNRQISIVSGGSASDTRGGYVQASGNEHVNTGSIQLVAGNVAGGVINLTAGGATQIRVLSGFSFQNVAVGNETTGGGTALLGTNSPAVTNTAPYTWLKLKTSDNSTVYVPAWK